MPSRNGGNKGDRYKRSQRAQKSIRKVRQKRQEKSRQVHKLLREPHFEKFDLIDTTPEFDPIKFANPESESD